MSWKNIYLDNYSYFMSSCIVKKLPVFKYNQNIEALLGLMNFYREKYQTKIQAYVIMPTHLHLILSSEDGENIKLFIQNLLRKSSLKIIDYFKSLESKKRTNNEIEKFFRAFQSCSNPPSQHAVWKERTRCVPIFSDKIMKVKLDYIHNNPHKAGLVKEPADYLYSSFRNYYLNDNSVFKIDSSNVLNLG
ncbi:MAG: transposase [candidate division Zixibacteria bacterium]|nr:transposase [candidate division Zixibacteria bacterium]